MTEPQKNPNEKLMEDLESTQNLLKELKQNKKQSSEDSRSWLPEKFYNTGNEKSRRKFPDKRYKTPWEAGGGKSKNEYGKKKSPNYNKFRSNQDEEFQKPSKISEKANTYNKPYKSRESRRDSPYKDVDSVEDRNYTHFHKPGERNTNKSANWKWNKFNKSKNYQESSYARNDDKAVIDEDEKPPQKSWETKRNKYTKWKSDKLRENSNENVSPLEDRDEKTSQIPRETRNTKHVHWKWDNQQKSMESRKRDSYQIPKSDDGDYKNYKRTWKRNTSQYNNTDWKWNKHNNSGKLRKDGANENAKYIDDEKFQKHWAGKKTKATNWKWGKRDQSPFENRNQRFKESRGWKSDKYENRNNKLETLDSKPRKDFEEFKNQGPKRKFKKTPYNPKYSKDMDKENNDPTKSRTKDIRPMSMVRRREWGASKTKWGIGPPLKFPLKYIFCLPTNKRRCFNLKQCTKELMYLQERHTCTATCPDIKYSFFIGTNGTVYECRGWRTRPGLPKKFEKINKTSLFIALAGKYDEYNTPPAMINARDYVIRYGVRHDLIDDDYILHSAVDHPTISESEAAYDRGNDGRESNDQGTQDHETQDQDTQDQDTQGQDTQDQATEDEDTQDQETEDQDTQDQETEDRENHALGSNWEDEFDDLSTVSGSSVKSWESYKSSWDLSEGDFSQGDLNDGDLSDGDLSDGDI